MKIQVGQVINSRGSGFYGWLIRFRNKLIYDKGHSWAHSAIVTFVGEKEVRIHEALRNGFVETVYSREEFEEKVKSGFFIVGQVKVNLRDVKKIAKEYEGVGYGFLDIFHIVLYWIFGTEAKFLFTGAQNLICSEAVARILYDTSGKKIDFEGEFGIPYDLIEPMHLWRSKWIDWGK